MAGTELADAFLEAAARAGHAGLAAVARDDLQARLAAVCERAERDLGEAQVARADLARYLGAHAAAEPLLRGEVPEEVAAAELGLVCALRRGDRAAAAIFERRYVTPLETTLARMRLDQARLDEVKQRVRAKLLVPDETGAMRVEGYAGQGRLTGLVQVVATRAAIDVARDAGRAEALGDEDLLAAGGARDPELEAIRAEARATFSEAFQVALQRLVSRDRNLLRLHLLGGVTLDQLAAMYGVHRATVVRWLSSARAQVLATTRATLRERLQLRPSELESLLGLAESRLDLSVERMLRTLPDDGADDVAASDAGDRGAGDAPGGDGGDDATHRRRS
jgi:RNA polymerase sigma-70 factor (ECF subfamily)